MIFWVVTLPSTDRTRRFGGSVVGNVRWWFFPLSKPAGGPIWPLNNHLVSTLRVSGVIPPFRYTSSLGDSEVSTGTTPLFWWIRFQMILYFHILWWNIFQFLKLRKLHTYSKASFRIYFIAEFVAQWQPLWISNLALIGFGDITRRSCLFSILLDEW